MRLKRLFLSTLPLFVAACAASLPTVPYPVYVQTNELPDTFQASLPGTRAKILVADASSRRSSMILQLPPDYSFSTGGIPDKTLEIYVLEGEVTLGEFELGPGGYAFLPSRSMGASMKSRSGALMLYFLDDVHPGAVIQTPIISDSKLIAWATPDSVDEFGMATKELRYDPGSGARTWLYRIEPGAIQSWQHASTVEEGFLVSGLYQHAECRDGIAVPGEYAKGGYYLRPADAVNGGPSSVALETSIWLVRVPEAASYSRDLTCAADVMASE